MIYDRCKSNVERESSRTGEDIVITPLLRHAANGKLMDYERAFIIKCVPRKSQEKLRLHHATMERTTDEASWSTAARKSLKEGYDRGGEYFGWMLLVGMNLEPEFYLFSEAINGVPKAITRCVEATYNELIEQFTV